jgi:hypothetical protein
MAAAMVVKTGGERGRLGVHCNLCGHVSVEKNCLLLGRTFLPSRFSPLAELKRSERRSEDAGVEIHGNRCSKWRRQLCRDRHYRFGSF